MNKEQELLLKLTAFGVSETQKELWLKEYAKEYHKAEVIRTWQEQSTWQLKNIEHNSSPNRRDFFIGSALQGLIASTPGDFNKDTYIDLAVKIADATIEKATQNTDNQTKTPV